MKLLRNLVLLLLAVSLTGCGYNAMQRQDEAVKAAWSEVLNQYQRRADLVPNLVNTVKGYAQHEEKVFVEVTECPRQGRQRAGQRRYADDPQQLQQFQAAQGELGSALSRLMVVSENYPQLKADGLFQNLQAQLEGTENRVTVARNRYVTGGAAVQRHDPHASRTTSPRRCSATRSSRTSAWTTRRRSPPRRGSISAPLRRHPPPRPTDDAPARARAAGWRWPLSLLLPCCCRRPMPCRNWRGTSPTSPAR